MVNYLCPRCHYETKYKPSIRNHYNRKKACNPVFSEISINECIQTLETPVKNETPPPDTTYNTTISYNTPNENVEERGTDKLYPVKISCTKTGYFSSTVHDYGMIVLRVDRNREYKNDYKLFVKDYRLKTPENPDVDWYRMNNVIFTEVDDRHTTVSIDYDKMKGENIINPDEIDHNKDISK